MDKTPEEIKRDDLLAQHTVIKGNIQVANDELSSILVKKDDAEDELEEVLKESERITNKTAIAQQKLIEESNLLEARRLSVERLEEEHQSKVASFNSFVENKTIEIEKQIAEATAKLAELNEAISKLSTLKENEYQTLTALKEQRTNIESEIAKLTTVLNGLSDKVLNQQEESNKFIALKKKEIVELLENKYAIEQEIELAKQKILLPQQLLDDRIDEFEKREKNLTILINRFRKEFKKLHPDQNPAI